jgi:hypothetical protein
MKVATAPVAQFPGVTFDKKESATGNSQIQKARVSANPPPLRRHYLDELAVQSVRWQKLAAGDREIDLLRPFVAARMRRDVPNFVAVREQGPGVGNEWVPCSYRSISGGIGELSAKPSNFRPHFALIITKQGLHRKGVMCNPGDVCCPRNMQLS